MSLVMVRTYIGRLACATLQVARFPRLRDELERITQNAIKENYQVSITPLHIQSAALVWCFLTTIFLVALVSPQS
jgi:hypothetical protein